MVNAWRAGWNMAVLRYSGTSASSRWSLPWRTYTLSRCVRHIYIELAQRQQQMPGTYRADHMQTLHQYSRVSSGGSDISLTLFREWCLVKGLAEGYGVNWRQSMHGTQSPNFKNACEKARNLIIIPAKRCWQERLLDPWGSWWCEKASVAGKGQLHLISRSLKSLTLFDQLSHWS